MGPDCISFSGSGFKILSTSYAGTQAEPSLRDEPVGSVRNIRLSQSNRKMSSKNDISATPAEIPTISLNPNQLKDTWRVEKIDENYFRVTGEKIEKFARRTDLNNYASVNRLRDIMKKLGIRAELTSNGAKPDSIIEIAGKQFTLVEE